MKGKISTNQIVIPVITGLIANLLFLLLSAIISYFVVIQPMLSDVKEKVEHSFEHICIIEDKIENIERNYLVKDVDGQKLQYTIFKINKHTYNIGRIHGTK